MRRSSLDSLDVAIDREVGSQYDVIKEVADNMGTLELLTEEVIADIEIVADNIPGIDTVNAAQEVIDNLSATVTETTVAGTDATAELVGSDIQLTIPRGVAGVNGSDGLTSVVEFSYEGGNLVYETTFVASNVVPEDEW